MLTLVIKQSLPNGISKTWKIRSTQELQTFGSSRLAQIISIDPLSKGIQGAFQYRDKSWYYLDLDRGRVHLSKEFETKILTTTKIKLDGSELSFELAEKEIEIFEKIDSFKTSSSQQSQKKDYTLHVVRYKGAVVEMKVLARTQKFNPAMDKNSDLEIISRDVRLDEVEHLMKVNPSDLLDKESKKGWLAVVVMGGLAFGLSLLAPSKKPVVAEVPKLRATKIVVLNDLKKKPGSQMQKIVQTKPNPPPVKEEKKKVEPVPTGTNVAGVLKSLTGGKLTQLLGKVSAQAAKSANAIVGKGIEAGSGPSGRALAAISNVDKSGKDWTKETNGHGVVISTKGAINGGGEYGKLSGGGTGQGNVGLIEDESQVTGGLDREIIAQVIKSQLGQILYCYERQLSAHPELEGKVSVKFTISGDGKVSAQKVSESSLRNSTVEGCILSRVSLWKFPAPQGGTNVVVTYPFLFKSTN